MAALVAAAVWQMREARVTRRLFRRAKEVMAARALPEARRFLAGAEVVRLLLALMQLQALQEMAVLARPRQSPVRLPPMRVAAVALHSAMLTQKVQAVLVAAEMAAVIAPAQLALLAQPILAVVEVVAVQLRQIPAAPVSSSSSTPYPYSLS